MAKSGGLDDDYKLALGSLVVEVSKMDSTITDLIAAVTGMDTAYALILVHHQQFSSKYDGLCALYRIMYPDENDPNFQPMKEMLDKAKEAADFRNSIVHTLWHIDNQGIPHTVRIQARGKLTRSRQPAPVEKIRQYVLSAIECASTFAALAKAYREFAKIDHQS
jgi:hypothetical protein